jgi:predicted RNA-binding Zn-ribbon protein involved in translation (DUF1610 family)
MQNSSESNPSGSEYHCPICRQSLALFERYPRYVCPSCAEKTCDDSGRRVDFRNLSFTGGCQGFYPDTNEIYPSQDCFIDGRPCIADEARFGGIVVQLKEQ